MAPGARLGTIVAQASRAFATAERQLLAQSRLRLLGATSSTPPGRPGGACTGPTTSTSLLGPSSACAAVARHGGPHWRGFSAEASAEPQQDETLNITDAALERLKELAQEDGSKPCLRIGVVAGGCSGFQYQFDLVEGPEEEDRIITREGVIVVTDEVSMSFLKGCKVDFVEDLIRSSFQIIDNPSAESSCGCGSSFQAKM